MFDRVVRESDDEAGRRRAASLAFTTAVCAAAIGGFVLGGLLFQAVQAPPAPIDLPISFLDEPAGGGGADTPLPSVPEKPRPEPTEPAPDAEPDPDAQPVATPAPEPSAPTGGGGGTGEGPGEGPGTGDGPPGDGNGSGDGDGDGVGTYREIVQPKLVVRSRVDPTYPDVAKALGLGEQRCLATVYIDERGVPYEVEIGACPSAFHAATRKALLQWRWYPPKSGQERVRTRTEVGITYRLDR